MGTEVINIDEESNSTTICSASGTSNQVNNLHPKSSSVDDSSGEARRNLWGPRLFGKNSELKELKESKELKGSKESKESNVKECTVTSPVETVCKRQEVHCVENSNQNAQTPKEGLNPEGLEPTNDEESDSPIKSPTDSANVGSIRPKQEASHPFPLATEASGENQPSADCAASENKPAKIKVIQSTDTPKKTKLQKSPIHTTRKSLQSDYAMHTDEEDSCSPGSSNGRSPKTQTTVPTAPVFRCSERAEKRKEFFAKVEQKHQALEAEKMQSEARRKEESEAALKQLRKNMVFKAKPMPSFYQEGPPPKVELKKPPPTRAKSPKLGRRKSLNDANRGDFENGICYRLSRHSFEVGKTGSNP